MRLLFIFLSIFLITGCSSINTTENTNSNVNEETYTREITDEELKYIQLILDNDYDEVIKQTESEDNEVQQDYYNIAFALKEYQEANNGGFNYTELVSKYSTVEATLEAVKYIPDELKERVEDVKKSSITRKEVYSRGASEELEREEKAKLKEEADYRTMFPQSVSIGMTQEEVLTKGWGRPQDINKTTTAYGVSEQWVYDGYKYLYFENGILTSIQE